MATEASAPAAEDPPTGKVAEISPLFAARQQLHDHWREGEMAKVDGSKLHVPRVLRVKWCQRRTNALDAIYIDVFGQPGVDFEVDSVAWTDVGLLKIKGKDWTHDITLPLLRPIDTDHCHWWVARQGAGGDAAKKGQTDNRSVPVLKMELPKAEPGLLEWDRLTTGERLTNVMYDVSVLPGGGTGKKVDKEDDQ